MVVVGGMVVVVVVGIVVVVVTVGSPNWALGAYAGTESSEPGSSTRTKLVKVVMPTGRHGSMQTTSMS